MTMKNRMWNFIQKALAGPGRVLLGRCVMGLAAGLLFAAFPAVNASAQGERMLCSYVGINLNPSQGDLLGAIPDEEELLAAGRALLEELDSEYAHLAIAHVDKYVNVRSTPSTDGKVLGKIYNGAVAQVLDIAGEDQDWFHVTSGSVEGYIKAEYFYYGQEAVAVIDDYVTRYAVVQASRLNVRKEPSAESSRVGYLNNGERAKIVENLGDWLKVQYSSKQTGYVSAEYVQIEEEFVYAISKEEEEAELARQKALEERKKQQEAAVPENTTVTVTVTAPGEYSTNTELRDSIVEYAKQFIGNPYVSGGNSLTKGTDCSGFTKLIYAEYGYTLGRTPDNQYNNAGTSIDYSQIQKGDIVCYGSPGKCTHVAIYIGDGMIVHAANKKKGICTQKATYNTILAVKSIID